MNSLNAPIFFAFFPFVAGIILFVNLQAPLPTFLRPFLIASLLLFLWHSRYKNPSQRRARLFTAILILAFFLAGWQRSHDKSIIYRDNYLGKLDYAKDALVVIKNVPEQRKRSIKAEAEIYAIKSDTGWVRARARALLYFPPDLSPRYGDYYLLKTPLYEVAPPANPHEFNYKRYLGFHQIHFRAFVPKDGFIPLGNRGIPLFKRIYSLREYLITVLQRYLPDPESVSVAGALLIGQRELLDDATKNNYSVTGAMHVLAVSGLHVGIVILLLRIFLPDAKSNPFYSRIFRPLVFLIAIWSYALLTGLSPSVTRAATMFSFLIGGTMLTRKLNIYHSIAASAFLLLLVNPFLITEIGFLLSYFAVTGIVYLQPRLYQLFYFQNAVLDKAWAITCVSIAAQIATFPIGLLFFYQFPVLFLLSNLIVIPAAIFIVATGIFLFIFSWLPSLASAIGFYLSWSITLLNKGIALISIIPGALISGIVVDIPQTSLLYLFIISSILYFNYKRFIYLRWAILFLISFSALTSFYHIENKNYRGISIYNIPGHTAIAFIANQKAYVVADSSLIANLDAVRFYMQHHWWNLGIHHPKFILTDTLPHHASFNWGSLVVELNKLSSGHSGNLIRLKRPGYEQELFILDASIHERMRNNLISTLKKEHKEILDYRISPSLNIQF